MSRCDCCNVILKDHELTRKSSTTGEYMMICDKCLDGLGIATIDDEGDENTFDEVAYDDKHGYDDMGTYYHDDDQWLSSDER